MLGLLCLPPLDLLLLDLPPLDLLLLDLLPLAIAISFVGLNSHRYLLKSSGSKVSPGLAEA
jgi:hypothetical protein